MIPCDATSKAYVSTVNEVWIAELLVMSPQIQSSADALIQREKYPVTEDFIKRASRLEKAGQTDAALDLIYDNVDGLLKRGKFGEVDLVLRGLDVASISANILLGILTSTLPAYSKLPARPKLIETVESVLKQRDEWEDNLLVGLEG